MDKKTVSFVLKAALAFIVLSVVIALIIQRGANHPPLRFYDLSSMSFDYINQISNRHDSKSCISIRKQGPFNWDNSNDLGMKSTLGKWANELDDDAVVYFRKDKDALWQSRAQNVRSSVQSIADELDEVLGTVLNSEYNNGRKMPIYLVDSQEEYAEVLRNLCGENHAPHQKNGTSVLELGPLGCQSKGIVINPDMFKVDENGAQGYGVVLRREIARYSYLSNVNFENEFQQNTWFLDGLIEYLADGDTYQDNLSHELVDYVRSSVDLASEAFRGPMADQASALFFSFYKEEYGAEALSELIQYSYTENVDSLFSSKQINLDSLKIHWINSMDVRLAQADSLARAQM